MSLKSFIIVSVVIHLVAGTALYFYYNPIVLGPKPVPLEEEKLKEPVAEEKLDQKIPREKSFSEETNPEQLAKADLTSKQESTRVKQPPLDKKEASLAKDRAFAPPEGNFLELEDQEEEKNTQKGLEKNSVPEERKPRLKREARDFSLLKQRPGNPPLSYPDFARRLKMQGTVGLLFFVDDRGLTEGFQLESSSGHFELDNFVLRVLSRYQFLENQEGWVRYEQTFRLEGEEKERLRLRRESGSGLAEERPKPFEGGFIEKKKKPAEELAGEGLKPKPEKFIATPSHEESNLEESGSSLKEGVLEESGSSHEESALEESGSSLKEGVLGESGSSHEESVLEESEPVETTLDE